MDLVQTYDTVTGARLSTLPASEWSWSRQISGAGSLTVTVPWTQALAGRDVRSELEPWRTTLAVVDSASHRVIAAGIVYGRRWNADKGELEISCEDLWAILKRRLVIDPARDSFKSGTIAGGDDGYGPAWTVSLTGSLTDIAVGLVRLATRHGALPVVLPSATGGSAVRTYLAPDFATVASRLEEITKVIDGPEVLFDPRIAAGGTALRWHMLAGAPELQSGSHSWDARRRATPLVDLSVEEDASATVTDSWARGGSQDDLTLLAHHHDLFLEQRGWPALAMADTSHSSVSEASTLMEWATAPTVTRSRSVEVVSVRVRRTDEAGQPLGDAVLPGDHVRVRHDDPYLGSGTLALKVLTVSGDAGEWVQCQCREVITAG